VGGGGGSVGGGGGSVTTGGSVTIGGSVAGGAVIGAAVISRVGAGIVGVISIDGNGDGDSVGAKDGDAVAAPGTHDVVGANGAPQLLPYGV
jgi:hypothetical protein